MAAEFVTAIKRNRIPAGGLTAIDLGGTRVAVANIGDAYYAFDDTCTHEQCSLAEGDLAGTTVTCMCHGAEFDFRPAPEADHPHTPTPPWLARAGGRRRSARRRVRSVRARRSAAGRASACSPYLSP